ncbi:MAG: DUF2183 domain-containing protein [Bacteroidia bacterium]|nr:DUF2183 domain-containing protein [Bacteroidia bacterium]
MSSWKKNIHTSIWRAETQIDNLRARFREQMGLNRDWYVQLYHGYASRNHVHVEGRVLQDRNIAVSRSDSFFTNLLNTYKRLGSREAPHAVIELRVLTHQVVLTADDEGYFRTRIDHDGSLPDLPFEVSAQLLAPEPVSQLFKGLVFPVTPAAAMGVISDVDDTILVTGATSLRQMARWTFLHNAHTRHRLPGVGQWYRSLSEGAHETQQNPFFYVSSSPWNFFDLLHDFICLNHIPQGPLLLRDYGIDEQKMVVPTHGSHKIERCEALFYAFPHLCFVLIGDAGQEDAFIYRELLSRHPHRIKAVIIRAVPAHKRQQQIRQLVADASAQGKPMYWIETSLDGAHICQELGLLNEAQVAAVKNAM